MALIGRIAGDVARRPGIEPITEGAAKMLRKARRDLIEH